MSLTPSKMLPLGYVAPPFSLPDTVSGKTLSLEGLKSEKATVIMFLCNHCPFVQHIIKKVVEVAKYYQKKRVAFIAINSNEIINYPEDSPEKMRQNAENLHFTFPYLFDETQEIARAYNAACTPDFFIFDDKLKCVYRGRFDEATPGKKIPVTGKDLTEALDRLLAHKPLDQEQKPSIGCNIKWK